MRAFVISADSQEPPLLSHIHYRLKPHLKHIMHPGANIHSGCKFASGLYFGHANGVF